jgi:hypothetical protein
VKAGEAEYGPHREEGSWDLGEATNEVIRDLRRQLATALQEREALHEALRGIRIIADADLGDVVAIVEAVDNAPFVDSAARSASEDTGKNGE